MTPERMKLREPFWTGVTVATCATVVAYFVVFPSNDWTVPSAFTWVSLTVMGVALVGAVDEVIRLLLAEHTTPTDRSVVVSPPISPSSPTSPDSDSEVAAKALETVAKEAWRLERTCDRLVTKLPVDEQRRYDGRLRWFRKQLDSSLEGTGVRLVSIEGQAFDTGTAATALNIEDFRPGDDLVVDKMIEPIVMGPNGIRQMGTVTLRRAEQ